VAELSELVAATIEAQQRCEVWSRSVVVVPCGRLAASAQTTAFVWESDSAESGAPAVVGPLRCVVTSSDTPAV
jgi:hypothetical protein